MAERRSGLEPDQQRGPSGICPDQPVHERSGRSCFSCERFRGSIVRSFRGGWGPTDSVRGDEPGGFGELRGAPARALIMPQARDAAAAARLWDASEKLVGTSFE